MKYDVRPQYLSFYPYYARDGQDKFLNEFIFKNKKNGIFVDIGAYDGVESSNTLFFEESLSWEGICVEPLKNVFKKLQKNRKCICINKCAANFNGKDKFMHVNPNYRPLSERETDRTSNYEKMSGLVNFYHDDHLKTISKIINSYGGSKNIFKVDCEDINNILDSFNKKYIDIFSIDTEGSELTILKHIDFKKYEIKIIIVEVLHKSYDILNFMKSVKYKKIGETGYDWIFEKI